MRRYFKKQFGIVYERIKLKIIMKERIKSIMKLRKTSIAKILLSVMVVSILGALFITLQACEDSADSGDGSVKTDDTPMIAPPVITQEQSNKLVLYMTLFNKNVLTPALKIFREKYPDVEIELREFSSDNDVMAALEEYKAILKTELAAGKGPDLILGTPEFDVQDLYKSMDAGVFLDLNSFIENDDEFNMDNYVKVALDSGIYKGKRYIMPVEYSVSVLLTTQEILDAEGITPSDLATFDGFIRTLENYNEKYKDNPNKTISEKPSFYDSIIFNILPWCGIELINYRENRVEVDSPHFKSIVEAMKWSYLSKEDSASFISYSGMQVANALQNQEWLFAAAPQTLDNLSGFYAMYSATLSKKLTPVIFPYPDINNQMSGRLKKYAAIPKTSQNQINAYNLLKIIVSGDLQSGITNSLSLPVWKDAVRSKSETMMYEGYYFEMAGGEGFDIPALDPPMSEQDLDEYIDMIINLDSCKILLKTLYNDFFLRDMQPYFENKKSYEECIGILKNNLELYMSE